MGDSFFRVFFASCFIVLFLAGAIMFYQMQTKTVNDRQLKAYYDSRGKTPIPSSIREKIGEGI